MQRGFFGMEGMEPIKNGRCNEEISQGLDKKNRRKGHGKRRWTAQARPFSSLTVVLSHEQRIRKTRSRGRAIDKKGSQTIDLFLGMTNAP